MRWAEPTAARVEHIGRMLRWQDRMEVLYSDCLTGEQAVAESWRDADICRCIDGENGRPVGICGVTGNRIWLLATDDLLPDQQERLQFIREGRQWVDSLFAEHGFRLLENWALASNRVTLRWLRHMGFTIDTAEPRGHSCMLFCHFWRAA